MNISARTEQSIHTNKIAVLYAYYKFTLSMKLVPLIFIAVAIYSEVTTIVTSQMT